MTAGIALRGLAGMIYVGVLGGGEGEVGDLLAGLASQRVARFKGFWLRRKFYSAPSG